MNPPLAGRLREGGGRRSELVCSPCAGPARRSDPRVGARAGHERCGSIALWSPWRPSVLVGVSHPPSSPRIDPKPRRASPGQPEPPGSCVTILFADIVGFTSMSAASNTRDLFEMLNRCARVCARRRRAIVALGACRVHGPPLAAPARSRHPGGRGLVDAHRAAPRVRTRAHARTHARMRARAHHVQGAAGRQLPLQIPPSPATSCPARVQSAGPRRRLQALGRPRTPGRSPVPGRSWLAFKAPNLLTPTPKTTALTRPPESQTRMRGERLGDDSGRAPAGMLKRTRSRAWQNLHRLRRPRRQARSSQGGHDR